MESNHIKPVHVTAGVITVSTTRTPETDTGGRTIRDLLIGANIDVVHYAIVPDDIGRIRSELYTALRKASCIVITGGTGLTRDDCTIEAVAPLLEKRMDGFGEVFRLKSFEEIGTAAILSRAVAGTVGGGAVFCIPGSVKAVTLATREIIIPEIAHILTHASSR
ncbi:MAG: molybdenum cofactor biosynthesis protein MoaB [Methanomicrobiaceae archaeon]|uniref:Molybdenum cofactor biosynthesis protein moab n=1 Tax=hydrocarbon metagenome TaxID=938273 RepID=A0A0W8FGM0_9ZZZZ|nr:molybdenum cofactor biosynthesis protein MoaB [Methanomicrobiaceae archaeon]MDD5418649.1 molybdenum cofactor biosynthesis protein MoaB [Methanomicrobiaceae archaeon]